MFILRDLRLAAPILQRWKWGEKVNLKERGFGKEDRLIVIASEGCPGSIVARSLRTSAGFVAYCVGCLLEDFGWRNALPTEVGRPRGEFGQSVSGRAAIAWITWLDSDTVQMEITGGSSP
jgi:hypothetical protein